MDEVTSLRGPVEKIEGKLTLLIPLEAGGDQFVECTKGIAEIHGTFLRVTIPEWLSGLLRIDEGSTVSVDNVNGKFNIHPINPSPIQ
jgi:hypothetical protein